MATHINKYINNGGKESKNRQKQQAWDLHGSTRASEYIVYYSFQFSLFMGLPNVWMSGSLILVLSLGDLFPPWAFLVQFQCDGFYLIIYFVVFFFVIS